MMKRVGGREVMKSLLVYSRIMLLDRMYPVTPGSNIGTTFTGTVHVHLSQLMMKGVGGREVMKLLLLVVRRIMLLDCMYPFMRGSNIGTTFTGKVHVHLS